MAIKVPDFEESVRPDIQQIAEPHFTKAPEAAFGAQVHRANARVGEAIQGIGEKATAILAKHQAEQNYWKEEQALHTDLQTAKEQTFGILHNDQRKKIKDANNVEYEVPDGILDKRGNETANAYDEYNDRTQPIYDKYMEKYKDNPRMQSKFAQIYGNYRETNGEKVVGHQSAEGFRAGKDAYSKSLFSTIEEAGAATSPLELERMISGPGGVESASITLSNYMTRYGKDGGDPASIEKNRNNAVVQAVNKAASAAVTSNGDLATAHALVDSQKEKMSPDDYNKILKSLDRQNDHFTAEQVKGQKLAQEKADTDFVLRYQNMSEHELENAHVLGSVGLEGGMSEKVYQTIRKAFDSKKKAGTAAAMTPEEKEALKQDRTKTNIDLVESFTKLVDEEGTHIDLDARFEDVASYKAKLLEARESGAITTDEGLNSRLTKISKLFDKGLDQQTNKAFGNTNMVWKFLKNAAANIRIPGAEKAVDENDPKFLEAKSYLANSLMERLGTNGIPDDQIQTVSQEILKDYLRNYNPDVLGAKDVPNNKATKESGIQTLHKMRVESNPDRTIKPPPPTAFKAGDERVKNGKTYVRNQEGEWLPKSQTV